MSFARIGVDQSTVYVFANGDGKYECQRSGHRFIGVAVDMLAHLDGHRADGDTVPDATFNALRCLAVTA